MGRRAFLPRRGSGLLHRSPAQRYFMYDDIFNEVSGARKRVQRIFYLRSAFTTFFPRRGLPSQVKGARLRALSRRSSSVQIAPLAFVLYECRLQRRFVRLRGVDAGGWYGLRQEFFYGWIPVHRFLTPSTLTRSDDRSVFARF